MAENYKYTEGKSYGGQLEMPIVEESLALSVQTSVLLLSNHASVAVLSPVWPVNICLLRREA